MTYLERVKETVYRAIGDLVQAEATARMKSKTLHRELVVSLDLSGVGGSDKIILSLPYYWAEYAHDGRAAIDLPPGRYMIFFPDRKDDPRTNYGTSYARTRAEAKSRHLSSEDYKRFREENRQRKAAGLPPVMVVTRHVGPAQGEFFFSLAWEQLVASGTVDAIVSAGLEHYLKALNQGFDREIGAANL